MDLGEPLVVLLLAMVLYTHSAEKCIVAFKCSGTRWTAPPPSLGGLLLAHHNMISGSPVERCAGVGNGGHPETALLVLLFLEEVGTKAGHGVHGDRNFPSDELRDSKLNHQNVWEVSQDSSQIQQYPGRDGVQACEWRLTELKGYGVMALVTSQSSY